MVSLDDAQGIDPKILEPQRHGTAHGILKRLWQLGHHMFLEEAVECLFTQAGRLRKVGTPAVT